MPRMRILTASEQEVFDKPPLFDHRERKKFFSLPKGLMDVAATLRTPCGQIGFLLMCGYFKATKRFYQPQDFHERDIEAAAKILELHLSDFSPDDYAKQTRARHQQLILEFQGFAPFDEAARKTLAAEIATMARMHLKPRLIFDRCSDFLIQHRVQIPQSGTLLELIRLGLQARKTELVTLMDHRLTGETRSLLDGLFTAPNDKNRYRLTLLKKLSQSTKPTRIKEGVTDFEMLAVLYDQLKDIISLLDLGMAGIRYFAGSVLKSRIFQLQQRSDADRYIHASAFVVHQYFRMQDNLVDVWLSVMASFQKTAAREHKEHLLENRKGQQEQLKTVVDNLDESVFGLIREIRNLTDADGLSDAQKITKIRALLDSEQTGAFDRLKADLEAGGQDRTWFDILENHSLKLQNRLSPILRALTFEPNDRAAKLIAAVDHFKANDGNIGERAPVDFLETDERAAMIRDDGTFRPSLYKVLLFQHVTGAIKSGDMNLAQSYKYRPMNTYLIDRNRWAQEKTYLLERAGLTEFADPDPRACKTGWGALRAIPGYKRPRALQSASEIPCRRSVPHCHARARHR